MIRPLTGREQNILAACVMTVVFCVLYRYVLSPIQEEADTVGQDIAARQEQLNKGLKALEEAKAVNGRYYAYLAQFRQTGTVEETSIAILSDIEKAAKRCGLRVTELKPRRPEQKKFGNRFAVNLTADSALSDMARFLSVLQRPPYVFRVEEIEFEKSGKRKQGAVTVRCLLSKALIPFDGKVESRKNDVEANKFLLEAMPFSAGPFETYAKSFRKRDLFQPPTERTVPGRPVVQKTLPALQQRIRLIGILLDGDSKAIVEDLEEREVRFLSKGESIATAFLEDIRKDKVIFSYQDKRVEMSP